MDDGIKVKCKKCGKPAPMREITLDPYFKMMVCQSCIKERLQREKVHKELKEQKAAEATMAEEKAKKPVGWDADDEILAKAAQERERNTVVVEKLADDKVKYTCPRCKYTFVYNVVRKVPASCPYCGAGIYRFRV